MQTIEAVGIVLKSMIPANIRQQNRPVRIRLNGQIMVLASGKSLWKTEGNAKSALRNHLRSCFSTQEWCALVKNEPSVAKLSPYLQHSAFEDLMLSRILQQIQFEHL